MDPRVVSFRAALDARPVGRFQFRLLALAVALLVMDGYDTQAIGYVAPVLSQAWHIERAAFGPVFSAGLVGLTLGALVFGPISDRLGARPVLLGCTGLYAVLTLATACAGSWEALLALRFLTGLGLGGAMPSAIALVADYAPTRVRNLMVAVAVCGFAVGGALGGLVAAVTIRHFGWQAVFILGGVVPLLSLPVFLRWLPESLARLLDDPGSRARLAATVDQVAPGWTGASPAPRPASPSSGSTIADLFRAGLMVPTLLIWTVFFCNLLLLFFFSNWLPTIVHGTGHPLETANLVTALFQISGVVGCLVLGTLADKSGRPRLVLACAFIAAAACCGLIGGGATSLATLAAGAAVAGFCIVGGQGMSNAFAGGYYPAAIRATGVGWALGVGRVGSILGPLIGGTLIGQGLSVQVLFGLFALPALLAATCILLVRARTDAAAPSLPAPLGAAS